MYGSVSFGSRCEQMQKLLLQPGTSKIVVFARGTRACWGGWGGSGLTPLELWTRMPAHTSLSLKIAFTKGQEGGRGADLEGLVTW